MKQVLYRHPDGAGVISYDAQAHTLCIANESKGTAAKASIGPVGLRELAAHLLALAETMEV